MNKQIILQIFETHTGDSEQSYLEYVMYCGGVEIASGTVRLEDVGGLLEHRGPMNTVIPISDLTALIALDYSANVFPYVNNDPIVYDEWVASSYKKRLVRGYSILTDDLIAVLPSRVRRLVRAVEAEEEFLEIADHEYEDVPF
ncbi:MULTISPECIES: hypothetical protein [unclassified Lentimonas]|uniref:hypothetical protein n=1 Tax=unclassified Lentimonas TaxID=2630993 RepID=UPI00132C4B5C|nr:MULTISPECIES: hypothetical protein [unclassified Lentimonas]CAA6679291.1 Unannotated [Lentimonas sp. CC4]CAA6686326.1 Unannotated [Lentimonas sp. CC6]CAA7076102.1 Unannotated [Lentimonas sp. CC4]CAA7170906.1 Unannotated [Lentimonas sp. CC21]CAA7181152.1 Unannotated [Lentimonas sp. CC8]